MQPGAEEPPAQRRHAAHRGVVFDLDGTLLDTLADIADAANRALSALGAPGHPLAAYRQLVGRGARRLMADALPTADTATIERAVEGFEREYAQVWWQRTRPYPGIPELLDELVENGFVMGVHSNKPHRFVELCIGRFLAGWPFAAVLGQQDGQPRKPAPAGALRVAGALALPPARCVYVGDSSIDMLTARAAGMLPLGVLWGFRDAAELWEAGADALFAHPAELGVWLARHEPGAGGGEQVRP